MINLCTPPDVAGFSRESITGLVFALDIIIVVVFCIYLTVMDYLVKKETMEFNAKNLTITDFALKFSNIPEKSMWNDESQLKAKLNDYIEEILKT